MKTKSTTLVALSLLWVLAVALPTSAADDAPKQPVAEKAAGKTGSTSKVAAEEKHAKNPNEKKQKTKLKIGKTDTVITVGDLHCKTCAKKIAGRLYTVKGVVKVRTDVKADVAIVTPQSKKKLSVKALWAAAQKSGFQPTLLEGPAGKYEADPKTKAPKLVPKKEQPATEKVAKKPA